MALSPCSAKLIAKGYGWRLSVFDTYTWPRVYKETENEIQDQDQNYKLQKLDKQSCKFDEIFTILSGM